MNMHTCAANLCAACVNMSYGGDRVQSYRLEVLADGAIYKNLPIRKTAIVSRGWTETRYTHTHEDRQR